MSESAVQPVFIFSLPRSGSTLLQRMLGYHPAVHTVSEPWLLLPLVYARRPDGVYAEYRHRQACRAIEDFGDAFPDKQAGLDRHLRDMMLGMYRELSPEGTRYFLDKTPPYILIADEIARLFPDAKLVFLFRNPLSVIASSLTTWWGNRWKLFTQKHLFYDGLTRMMEAYEAAGDRAIRLNYEDLIADPPGKLSGLFEALGLPDCPEAAEGFSRVKLEGRVQDNQGIQQYSAVSKDPVTKWQRTLANPLRRRFCRRYLSWVGRDRLATMGYDLDELNRDLRQAKGTFGRLASDAGWMAAGSAYCALDVPLVRDKLRAWRQRRPVLSHA
ncbi:MAG: sulfotransferase [Planctomycetota bacterium]